MGGEVLTIIYEDMSGDPTANTLYGTLLHAAGKPRSFVMARRSPHRQSAGKLVYLRLEIRRDSSHSMDEELTLDDEKFYVFVEDAYTQIVLCCNCYSAISSSFRVSRPSRYTSSYHNQLRKTAKSASIIKLQSLLDLALNTDSQGDDTLFREEVKVTMATSGLYEWLLNVVNVSGVIDGEESEPEAHYQEQKKEKDDKKPMLVTVGNVDRAEDDILAYTTASPPGAGAMASPRVPPTGLHALSRTADSRPEPNRRALEGKLANVTTVDKLLRDHVHVLDTCLKECMLTSSELLRAYSRLFVTCSTFALYKSSFTKYANQAIAASETPDGHQAMSKRWEFLGKFETNFNHQSLVHLADFYASSENVSLLPLVVRLNSVKTGA
ncbi:hypothetical protein GGX14DRAFT_388814 [Mycena pura]|uniref:Spindle pole body component n=1 Tax=Mycena pura TaxID=153505 RepID=A0AAD6VT06_9AGAR|nr:hypothetical protein GGX14DRAFT_388814 [Mycena pura]